MSKPFAINIIELTILLKELSARFKLDSLRQEISACESFASSPTKIDIAVFGRFKAGKSSFLNHLIGRPVLPVAAVPLTAVITRLRYGPNDRAIVEFLHGQSQEIPITQIKEYVTEKENPANQKNVAAITVELPQLKDLSPLEFVDTPGVGSAFMHNTLTTHNWLPYVGTAIVATSADAPLAERDISLISEIRKYTPRIVILLTKADLLDPEQQKEVLEFTQSIVNKQWDSKIPIYFYSVKPGFEKYRELLFQKVLIPLLEQRESASMDILRYKFNSALTNARSYLQLGLTAATKTKEAQTNLVKQLTEELTALDLLSEQLELVVRELDATSFEKTLQRLQPETKGIENKLTTELSGLLQKWRIPVPKLLDQYMQWLTEKLREELHMLSENRRDLFLAPLNTLHKHLSATVQAFHEKLAQRIMETLGITLSLPDFTPRIIPPENPPIDVGVAFDVTLDLIGYLIPMPIFGKLIHRRLINHARYEIRKNISRLTASWRDKTSKAMHEMKRQAMAHLRTEILTLLDLAQKPTTDIEVFTEYLRRIDDALKTLEDSTLYN